MGHDPVGYRRFAAIAVGGMKSHSIERQRRLDWYTLKSLFSALDARNVHRSRLIPNEATINYS